MVPPTVFLHAECPANALCPEHDPATHLLFHEQEFEACENRLKEILVQCPACPNAIFFLISCLAAMERYAEADLLLERLLPAANNDSQLSDLCRLKGKILEEYLGPKEAIDWYQRAAELERNSAALSLLADMAWKLRRRKQAINLANEAFEREPYDPVVLRRCFRILIRAGQSETAQAHLLGLAKREYEVPDYHSTIGQGLVYAGLERKGLALARRAARAHPESVGVACTVSQLLLDRGRLKAAALLLRRLLKLDPAGHGKFGLINLAMISARTGDAQAMLRHAIQANREYDDPDTRRMLRRATATVTSQLHERERELGKLESHYAQLTGKHEALQTSVAGYDLTEGGTNLEYALREGEGWHVELKERMPDQARDMAREIAALSSQVDGGSIFIGVRDDGTVVGAEDAATLSERDSWRHRIAQIATKTVRPPNPVTVYFPEHAGSVVVKIWVPEGSAPIYYVDDIAYIRNIDESRKATHEEVEDFIARRSKRQ